VTTPKINIGLATEPRQGRIDPDAAMAYALATNDPNPIYMEGRAVPPLYTVSLILASMTESLRLGVEPGAINNVRSGVHGSHDVYFHRPLGPGSEVTWTSETSGAEQTPAGVQVPQKVVVSDAAGPAVTHYWTTLYIGGQIIPPVQGERLADHLLPAEAKARPLGNYTTYASGDQSFRYAGASTDHAVIHIDDVAAQRAGFPSKFLQGLCTFAMCTGGVVKVLADGDPNRVRRLAGRFSSPMFPRHELVVDFFDIGPGAEGIHLYGFEASSDGQTVVKHGRAEIDE
jgi:acyl dehydratase